MVNGFDCWGLMMVNGGGWWLIVANGGEWWFLVVKYLGVMMDKH